jgi:TRAP-type mannitol/chloroaromatic compound transport system permease small subunit
MLLTVADVLKRTLFDRGIPGTVEITQVFLVIVVFAAMFGAEVTDTHVSTTIVTDRLPARARQMVRLIGATISFLAASLFAYANAGPALQSLQINEVVYGLIRVPVYPAKIVIFLGFLLLALAILGGILRQILSLSRQPVGTLLPDDGSLPNDLNASAELIEAAVHPSVADSSSHQRHEKVPTHES